MPLLLPGIALAVGAVVGGSAVYVASDVTKKVTILALIGGAAYLYAKHGR